MRRPSLYFPIQVRFNDYTLNLLDLQNKLPVFLGNRWLKHIDSSRGKKINAPLREVESLHFVFTLVIGHLQRAQEVHEFRVFPREISKVVLAALTKRFVSDQVIHLLQERRPLSVRNSIHHIVSHICVYCVLHNWVC